MKALRNVALLAALISVGEHAAAQQPTGSQLPQDENSCATCHGESELWGGENLRLFVPLGELAEDAHWKSGVNCHDCHGGDPGSFNVGQAHARQVDGAQSGVLPFRPALSEQIRSPARLQTQVEVCRRCHEQASDAFMVSVHGHGLQESGLVVTAVCTDCHGSHGIYPAFDRRSTLHFTNVGATCARCHQFIQERVQQSVHGRATAPPETAGRPAPGEGATRTPSCVDCHSGHDRPHPRSTAFRLGLPDRCGNCHAELSSSYSRSLHGELTQLGYLPAAKCSDCHGSHDILPVNDPQSRVFPARRMETCRQCHAGANANFANFDPHADHRDPTRSPTLHYTYVGMEVLIYSVFGFFGLHTLFWFIRSIAYRVKHGRPRRLQPGEAAYVRFDKFHRTLHVIVIVSFLGLAFTGLPLKYSEQQWAQRLAGALGGFESTSFWHRVCAMMTAFYFAAHLAWLMGKIYGCRRLGMTWRAIMFGPDSMVPNARDFRDLYGMARWFLWLGRKPVFERWTYWEKFDYWAVFWGVAIIGTSGLLLWFPEFFCRFLPGQALNVAKVIHSEEALLATGFIFTIHFFNTHLRAERFPMDMSMLTGLVSEDELKEERPELVHRLQESGRLERLLTKTPPRRTLVLTMIGGFIAVAIGLALLVGILIAVF